MGKNATIMSELCLAMTLLTWNPTSLNSVHLTHGRIRPNCLEGGDTRTVKRSDPTDPRLTAGHESETGGN